MSRRRKPHPTRALRMAMMRDLPVGAVFIFTRHEFRTLYLREPGEMVRCLVNAHGQPPGPTTKELCRINGNDLSDDWLVVHLSAEEQVRRHMLAVHGLGAKAIEP